MDRQVTIESVKLVEQLKKIFPKKEYFLISLQEKFYIWEEYMDISKEKPIKQYDNEIRSKELLTTEDKKFFESLYGDIKPESIINFNLKSKFIENNDDVSSKTLILGEDFINSENQRVLKFTFINFREYFVDELKEKKLSELEFIDSLVNSFHSSEEQTEYTTKKYYLFEGERIVIPALIVLILAILFMV
ncbi:MULTISPECIES: hypothetical protein [Cetobacterium]|jgi:hypothetical protein|uniref:Uncharacterized protein n=1 Tax=Candidatus Cetobacterium colombiensis TaxID=3073100 RepID=A0ABU4WB60_9FUSO|nr:hypothetical protein [Candidatus Cetobacterium colombiensis]MDX8335635.1 hypothetical protein [Candidatus Cetobacterium colombiensis]